MALFPQILGWERGKQSPALSHAWNMWALQEGLLLWDWLTQQLQCTARSAISGNWGSGRPSGGPRAQFTSAQGRIQVCLTATLTQTLSVNTHPWLMQATETNCMVVITHHAQQMTSRTPKGCVCLKRYTDVIPLLCYIYPLFAGGQWEGTYHRIGKDFKIASPWWSKIKIMTRFLLSRAQCHFLKVSLSFMETRLVLVFFLSVAELEAWHDSIHIF